MLKAYGMGCGVDVTMLDSMYEKRKEPIRTITSGNYYKRAGVIQQSETWTWHTTTTFEADVSANIPTNSPVTIFGGMNFSKTTSKYKSAFGNYNTYTIM